MDAFIYIFLTLLHFCLSAVCYSKYPQIIPGNKISIWILFSTRKIVKWSSLQVVVNSVFSFMSSYTSTRRNHSHQSAFYRKLSLKSTPLSSLFLQFLFNTAFIWITIPQKTKYLQQCKAELSKYILWTTFCASQSLRIIH